MEEKELVIREIKKINPKYPFIDKLVDTLYDQTYELINNHVENNEEKSIFMMFILIYYTVHLRLTDNISESQPNKDTIKNILTNIIEDPDKRRLCLQMFENKIKGLFVDDGKVEAIKDTIN